MGNERPHAASGRAERHHEILQRLRDIREDNGVKVMDFVSLLTFLEISERVDRYISCVALFRNFANGCVVVMLGARLANFLCLVLNVLTILNSYVTFLFECRRMQDLKNDLDKRIPKLDLTITETEMPRATCWWAGLKKEMENLLILRHR